MNYLSRNIFNYDTSPLKLRYVHSSHGDNRDSVSQVEHFQCWFVPVIKSKNVGYVNWQN